MKQKFVSKADAPTTKKVFDLNPWAIIVIPVEGGWMIFESNHDLQRWKRQV